MISSFYKTNCQSSWTKNFKNRIYFPFLSILFSFSLRSHFLKLVLLMMFPIVFLQCASSGFGTQGMLYENQRISLMETGTPATKEGFACAKSYLGLVALGNASMEEAQKQGNIREITSIELETYNFLGIYAKLCTVTKGN